MPHSRSFPDLLLSHPSHSSVLEGVFSRWAVGETIGQGSFSMVRACENVDTGVKAVVKSSSFNLKSPHANVAPFDPHSTSNSKANLSLFSIRELACLIRASTHPNVVSLYDFAIETDSRQAWPTSDGALAVKVHMVLERVEGIELFDFLKSNGGAVSEQEVAHIMSQLMSALAHIHSLSLTHRDIKLDNLLYDRTTGRLVLIDFNLSSFYHPEIPLTEPVGCVHYASPAVLQCATRGKGYGYMPQAGWGDLWGSGVVAYGLLCGYFPFRSSNPSDLLAELASRTLPDGSIKLDWPSIPPSTLSTGSTHNTPISSVSAIARDFVETLLNPANRDSLSASFMRCHPFLADHTIAPRSSPRARAIADETLRGLCAPSLVRQEENVRAWVEEAVRTAMARREARVLESNGHHSLYQVMGANMTAPTVASQQRYTTEQRDAAPFQPTPSRIRILNIPSSTLSTLLDSTTTLSPSPRRSRSPLDRARSPNYLGAGKLHRSISGVSASRHRRAASAVAPGHGVGQKTGSAGSHSAGKARGYEMP
ncbi:hypothetical protein HDU93_007913 [Gonapodya sp. JEL0774]|nr:hypothetical protein HDU93_007913 [Gonapodya sp. JEL0774]